MIDRRRVPRNAARLKVVWWPSDAPEKRSIAKGVDISLSGIGLKTADPALQGRELDIVIYRPLWEGRIEAKGLVVWQSSQKPGEVRAGIQFTHVPWTQLGALINSLK